MGFWKDVRELKAALKANAAAGSSQRRAMIEAVQDRALALGTVQAVNKSDAPETMKELLAQTPPGQQVKLTSVEYRRLMGQK